LTARTKNTRERAPSLKSGLCLFLRKYLQQFTLKGLEGDKKKRNSQLALIKGLKDGLMD
jgi:hypothetical protein